MAFGGVEIGNVKAKEAEIAAGIIKISGSISIALAIAAITGNIVADVAVLDENSVKVVTIPPITNKIKKIGILCMYSSCRAICLDKPDDSNPCASANPPPNSNIISQGIDFIDSLLSNFVDKSLKFAGVKNKTTAPKIPIVPSSINFPIPNYPPSRVWLTIPILLVPEISTEKQQTKKCKAL